MKKLALMLGVLFSLSACDKQINITITEKNPTQNESPQAQTNLTLNDSSNNFKSSMQLGV